MRMLLRYRIRIAASLAVIAAGASSCRTAQVEVAAADHVEAIADVRRVDAGWANSYAVHDTAYAMALFAPDIVITSSDGTLKNREAELKDIRPSPEFRMEYFRTMDVNVRVYGSAAVATGLASWKFVNQGRESSVSRRYTAVYARGGRLGWQMVALQLGRAPT